MSSDHEQRRTGLDQQHFGGERGAVREPQTLRLGVVLNAAAPVDEQIIISPERGGRRHGVAVGVEMDVMRVQMVGGAVAQVVRLRHDEDPRRRRRQLGADSFEGREQRPVLGGEVLPPPVLAGVLIAGRDRLSREVPFPAKVGDDPRGDEDGADRDRKRCGTRNPS
jgi:hypothetical protein